VAPWAVAPPTIRCAAAMAGATPRPSTDPPTIRSVAATAGAAFGEGDPLVAGARQAVAAHPPRTRLAA